MSRFISLLTLFLLLLALPGCEQILSDQTIVRGSGTLGTEPREVPAFSEVRVNSNIDVSFAQGSEQQVVASADDNVLPYLRTEVRDDVLIIEMRSDSSGGLSLLDLEYQPEVQITAPAVTTLVTNSSGDITAGSMAGERLALESSSSGSISVASLEATALSIRASSSGNVEVGHLDVADMNVVQSSNGDVTVAGTAGSQVVELSSSGDYNAGDLQSRQARVTVDSSGSATVWASDSLEATTTSSGTVSYYGSPSVAGGEVVALGVR